MRKTILATLLSVPLLTGCATTGGVPGAGQEFVTQVTAITRAACAFLPTAETVLAILAAGQFTAPVAIANAICSAVTAPKPLTAARGVRAAPPKVGNVTVKGQFVK